MNIVDKYKDKGYIIGRPMNFEVKQLASGEIYEPYNNAKN